MATKIGFELAKATPQVAISYSLSISYSLYDSNVGLFEQ